MSVTTPPATSIRRASLRLATAYVAPKSELEALAAATFAEVFNLDQVGINDEFFELGGDSLLAEALSLALSERTGFAMQPSLLVERGSPRQIAELLRSRPAKPSLEQEAPADQEIERRIRAFTADWGGERTAPGSLLFALNRSGTKRPVFWCFQGAHEFDRLATHLGRERPLYGMRSGYLAMEQTEANSAALAKGYTEEILAVDPQGPYLIGGNCRGGIEAVAIARRLQDLGRQVLLLTLLDVRLWEVLQGRAYAGKVAAIAGIYSRFSPYRRFRWPELGWRKLVPEGLKLDLLPADHGQYFSAAVMPLLAGKVHAALEWAEAPASGLPDKVVSQGPLPEGAYRASLRTSKSLKMTCGESRSLAVRVRNSSRVAWPATADSGIALGNHWLSAQGELLAWSDGRAALRKPLLPGQTATVRLETRAPNLPGDYLLEIDLVEEGVTWFKEHGSPAAIVSVTVSERPKRAGWFAALTG